MKSCSCGPGILPVLAFALLSACGGGGNEPADASDGSGGFDAADGSMTFDASGVRDASDGSGEFDGSDASFDSGSPDGSIAPVSATFIVFAKEPSQFDSYLELANRAVEVAYRSPSPHPADQDSFETQGRAYYFTAASSDYPNYEQEPLYVDLSVLEKVAARPHCRGFYLHEVMTLAASKHSWNWQAALAEFDWNWMDQLVSYAGSRGKKVIWSEPSYAWQTLDGSSSAALHFESWGTTVIPMFATNFPTQMDNSREHAGAVASRYGLPLGESHQAWYFHDSGIEVTRQGSFDLAKAEGWDHGAEYFQFEGQSMDLYWDSPYMLGIRDFSSYLLASGVPKIGDFSGRYAVRLVVPVVPDIRFFGHFKFVPDLAAGEKGWNSSVFPQNPHR